MLEFATVYVRSIIGILSISAVTAYLQPNDPLIIGGYMTAVVAMVMLDKGAPTKS